MQSAAYELTYGGIKTANTVPYKWVTTEFQEQRGPVWCATCKKDGAFEDVFYSSCDKCSIHKGHCTCVYCRVANKDGHQHLVKRNNIFNFVKELQKVVNDLRRDYPNDEYGIVADAIESGFYILNLHTAKQYELMSLDEYQPFEMLMLSVGELTYRWNPKMEVPETVILAAVKAAKRMGILSWVKEMWSGTKYKLFLTAAEEDGCGAESSVMKHSELCDRNMIYMDYLSIPYCCSFDLWHKEKLQHIEFAKMQQNEHDKKKFTICDKCGDTIPINGEKYTGVECRCDEDYDIQCSECSTWIPKYETNEKGYCIDCQNPDYDPAWPKGD